MDKKAFTAEQREDQVKVETQLVAWDDEMQSNTKYLDSFRHQLKEDLKVVREKLREVIRNVNQGELFDMSQYMTTPKSIEQWRGWQKEDKGFPVDVRPRELFRFIYAPARWDWAVSDFEGLHDDTLLTRLQVGDRINIDKVITLDGVRYIDSGERSGEGVPKGVRTYLPVVKPSEFKKKHPGYKPGQDGLNGSPLTGLKARVDGDDVVVGHLNEALWIDLSPKAKHSNPQPVSPPPAEQGNGDRVAPPPLDPDDTAFVERQKSADAADLVPVEEAMGKKRRRKPGKKR